jgi:hypothetical protein
MGVIRFILWFLTTILCVLRHLLVEKEMRGKDNCKFDSVDGT